jgi:hypothetical protein
MTEPLADDIVRESDGGYVPLALRDGAAIPPKRCDRWQNEAQTAYRPAVNGYNDPLSHLLLIDELLRLSPHQTLRARALREHLTHQCPQVIWDTITVGRIMSELADLADEAKPDDATPPIVTGRDRFGRFFELAPVAATYKWLADLRERASTIFHEELKFIADGLEPPSRSFPIWESAGAN